MAHAVHSSWTIWRLTGSYPGTIYNFLPGDTIDITGIGTATGTTPGANGVLFVEAAGSIPLNLDPTQSYQGKNFLVTPDGNGGTDVTINQPPVTTAPDSLTTALGQITPIAGLSVADADATSANETITVTLSDSGGLLAAVPTAGGTVDGSGPAMLTLAGNLNVINTELGTVSYTDASGIATDTIDVSTSDGRGGQDSNQIAIIVSGSLSYTFEALSTPQANAQPFGISNNGTIAGGYFDASGNHGFTYGDEIFSTIDDPQAHATAYGYTSYTTSTSINNSGAVVGTFTSSTGFSLPTSSFIENNGTFTTISLSIPSYSVYATDISDDGSVVGWYEQNINGALDGTAGFLEFNGVTTKISDPLAPFDSYLSGINDAGIMVGWYLDSTSNPHGFVDDNGTFSTIDDPSASNYTVVTGISDAGLIVGYYKNSFGDDRRIC